MMPPMRPPPGPMGPPGMPPPGMPPPEMGMGMDDLGMGVPETPEGVMLWGNPVLDAPPVELDMMFPAETMPSMPPVMGMMQTMNGLPAEMGGMGPPPMDQEGNRQAAIAALQGRARARLGASEGFQNAATNMGKPGF